MPHRNRTTIKTIPGRERSGEGDVGSRIQVQMEKDGAELDMGPCLLT